MAMVACRNPGCEFQNVMQFDLSGSEREGSLKRTGGGRKIELDYKPVSHRSHTLLECAHSFTSAYDSTIARDVGRAQSNADVIIAVRLKPLCVGETGRCQRPFWTTGREEHGQSL